jgi:hypothetical protein
MERMDAESLFSAVFNGTLSAYGRGEGAIGLGKTVKMNNLSSAGQSDFIRVW